VGLLEEHVGPVLPANALWRTLVLDGSNHFQGFNRSPNKLPGFYRLIRSSCAEQLLARRGVESAVHLMKRRQIDEAAHLAEPNAAAIDLISSLTADRERVS
jgi:hypothetical protein